MDNPPKLNEKQHKQFIQMLNLFNNGYTINESIFPHLYVFRHHDITVVDKVLLIDDRTMLFYHFFYD